MNASNKRGLGKGLSALMGESYSQTSEGTGAQKPGATLPLGRLMSGKFQPRQSFDEGNLKELAASISKNGIMQPIIVRESSQKKGMYEIIAGERRWRAAKLAGLGDVPVIIREAGDQQALELALVENVQRQDLNPIEEALGYQRLIDDFSYTQEALSGTVGKSRSHISNTLRLLALPVEIREMVSLGQLSAGHARALINAPSPIDMAKEIIRRGLNVRQTENFARLGGEPSKQDKAGSRQRSSGQGASGKEKDADILALEETLSENLGLKVSINDQGQKGDIVLYYNNLSELDEILRRLGGSV